MAAAKLAGRGLDQAELSSVEYFGWATYAPRALLNPYRVLLLVREEGACERGDEVARRDVAQARADAEGVFRVLGYQRLVDFVARKDVRNVSSHCDEFGCRVLIARDRDPKPCERCESSFPKLDVEQTLLT